MDGFTESVVGGWNEIVRWWAIAPDWLTGVAVAITASAVAKFLFCYVASKCAGAAARTAKRVLTPGRTRELTDARLRKQRIREMEGKDKPPSKPEGGHGIYHTTAKDGVLTGGNVKHPKASRKSTVQPEPAYTLVDAMQSAVREAEKTMVPRTVYLSPHDFNVYANWVKVGTGNTGVKFQGLQVKSSVAAWTLKPLVHGDLKPKPLPIPDGFTVTTGTGCDTTWNTNTLTDIYIVKSATKERTAEDVQRDMDRELEKVQPDQLPAGNIALSHADFNLFKSQGLGGPTFYQGRRVLWNVEVSDGNPKVRTKDYRP